MATVEQNGLSQEGEEQSHRKRGEEENQCKEGDFKIEEMEGLGGGKREQRGDGGGDRLRRRGK